MPLYNSKRDSKLLMSVNREVMHRISSVEVAFYKLDISTSEVNIYEEAELRSYNPAVRLYSQIIMDSKTPSMSEVQDFERTISFGFLRDDVENLDVNIEEGDIIEYDGGFYEVDRVSNSNYWSGRNPRTALAVKLENQRKHGYVVSIVAECHLTRTNSLHIVDTRVGNNHQSTRENTGISKFIR